MILKTIGHHDGQPVQEVTLKSNVGVEVTFISFGAIVRDWQVPVNGKMRHVVLGFNDHESYLKDDAHLGAIVGRVANRIGGARFSMNGKSYSLPANVGADHLHGGPSGFSRKNWTMSLNESDPQAVTFTLHSSAGDMGYPGAVDVKAVYRLDGYRLRLELSAKVSETTPVSLVQHHYFNLLGQGNVLNHHLQIQAGDYTPLNSNFITTGEIVSVEGTRYDFREGQTMSDSKNQGSSDFDINFVLSNGDRKSQPAAVVTAPDKSLQLKLWTDRPGLQLYNSIYLNAATPGVNGEKYGKYAGLCLEDQMLPDAVNKPNFPSVIVEKGKPYSHWNEIEIRHL